MLNRTAMQMGQITSSNIPLCPPREVLLIEVVESKHEPEPGPARQGGIDGLASRLCSSATHAGMRALRA
jgi:hypothetical protein